MTSLADRLRIDADRGSPYEQVRDGVIDLVNAGDLLVGVRLPTVRALAADLGIAPNTVARAYRELEAAGVIETRGRQGSFVKSGADEAAELAEQTTVDYVAAMRAQGIDGASIITMVTRAVSIP